MTEATNSNILEPGDFELLPVLWSPRYDKTSRWKAHKASPQNHETISIYTRLPGMVLTPLAKEEKEIDTFSAFSVHVGPNGTQMTHYERGEPKNGKREALFSGIHNRITHKYA